MTGTLRLSTGDDADLGAIAAIVNAVTPDHPTSIEDLQWASATYPGGVRILAESGGRPVGVGTCGRIYMYPPEFAAWWATISVLPDARRSGIGSTLLAALSERARSAGKSALHVPASEARPEGIEFLGRRGFTEYERDKAVELPLAGLVTSPVAPPDGVLLTSLAERPDLVAGVHLVACEAFADIPGGDEPMAAGDLAEFRARDVDRPSIPPGGFIVATEAATGQVIGYASLIVSPATGRRIAWHDMTAVVRAWRGRGLAGSLKRATIRWAVDNAIDALQTGNDTDNAPMRAVNARLGYRPLPDLVTMRGPLFNGIMDGS